MSDYISIAGMFFLMLFAGFISYIFLKDVVVTAAAAIRKNKNTTKLTPWQMTYHLLIGIAAGAAAIMFLLGVVLYFDIRNRNC